MEVSDQNITQMTVEPEANYKRKPPDASRRSSVHRAKDARAR